MTKKALTDTYKRIKPYVHRTPVLTSSFLDELTGMTVFLKCENFQKMGAFKMRGAANAILNLSKDQLKKGVVTHSSGNFAQAVSLAAKKLKVKAYIVMPSSAPKVKQSAVEGYGGIITICPPTLADREAATNKIIESTGATFLHPSNQIEVILGQGTAAMELLEDHPDLNYVFTPVGGGGLLAGTALAVEQFGKKCNTVGAEPFEADDAYRSLLTGNIEVNETTNTVADGLRTILGDVNFPIIQKYVDTIIRVEEKEIINAMKFIWERMKIIIEPSSAVPIAALIKEKEQFKGKKIGIIISGGNVDLSNLPF